MMATGDPGPIIGKGRAADVFDIGAGRVLRRNRDGSATELEAAAMQYLSRQGYPVPRVYDSDGADLVMERIHGSTMSNGLARQPWMMGRWARDLASLHHCLEAVALPPLELPGGFGDPEVLVHADLHPDNVMLTRHGPVVIDWTNLSLGRRGSDAANTWVITATSQIDAPPMLRVLQAAGRSLFLREFLRHVGRARARTVLSLAAAHRLQDRNLRPGEEVKIHRLLNAERVDLDLPS